VRREPFQGRPPPCSWVGQDVALNPGAVQRILRHSDPRITTETYGHLQPDYLRSEIDRLRFGTAPADDLADPSSGSQRSAAFRRDLLTTFLQGPAISSSDGSGSLEISDDFSEVTLAGWTGLEPAASGVTARAPGIGGVSSELQTIETIGTADASHADNFQRFAPFSRSLLTTFLQGFMTVPETAQRLGVSRPTVYQLCERSELRHVRVSNAIRVPRTAIAEYLRRRLR
jgi:excisionase family DNA binding protein